MNYAQILIVEDEVFIATGLQSKLEHFGYTVCGIASSGEEAIEKAIESHPDLVLMDIVLKGEMDGIEAARRIRDQFQIPVIYLTAYGDDKILDRAKTTEPFGYLLKPFNERELQISIEICLYKHNLEKKFKEQQQWYSTILKSLGEAVITIGINHSILFMNPVAEEIFNCKQKIPIGRKLNECFSMKSLDKPVDFFTLAEEVLHNRKTIRNSQVRLEKEESTLIFDLCMAPIQNDEGIIKGAVLIFNNRTGEAQMQKELLNQEEDLKKTREIVIDLLTSREREVLHLIVDGQSTKEIAAALHISPRTIEFHRYNLMRKLKVKDIPSLVRYAITKRIVPVD